MMVLRSLNLRFSCVFFVVWIFINPGFILSAVVTLDSIEIFNTHELFRSKPTVYFNCKGENKTFLPDIKEANVLYAFKGKESWQPMIDFSGDHICKQCGFYEKDTLKQDDLFDEWEFCPSDFKDGKYTRVKEMELSVTFLCPKCNSYSKDSSKFNRKKGLYIAIIVLASGVSSTILIIVSVAVYKYWQKKKRQQDQARFLKLFEDGDDSEDELGLDNVM